MMIILVMPLELYYKAPNDGLDSPHLISDLGLGVFAFRLSVPSYIETRIDTCRYLAGE